MKRFSVYRGLAALAILTVFAFVSCNVPAAQNNTTELTQTMQALDVIVSGTQTALAQQAQATPLPPTTTNTPVSLEAASPTPVPSSTPIIHALWPAEPGYLSYWIWDRDSSSTANEKRAPGGDQYNSNQLERPFSAREMVYRPDLDITRADLTEDANFYYVLITLVGVYPNTNAMEGAYGVEIDLDKDGRGDYLVMANKPFTTAWDTLNVRAYTDSNNDVGGPTAIISDAPFTTGNGYDQLLFAVEIPADPDLAWARISPSNPHQIQIAFRKSLINGATQFMWGVFSDDALRAPEKMDYVDFFTLAQAGSPLINSANYPLLEIHSMDNTCRLAWGFVPTGSEPGICQLPDPTPTPTLPNPPNFVPGTVNGRIWVDNNENGIIDPTEPGWTGTIGVGRGACAPVMIFYGNFPSDANGYYYISGLPAGTYCVYWSTSYSLSTPKENTITIVSGSAYTINFGIIPIGK
jgi:hypothetical protein